MVVFGRMLGDALPRRTSGPRPGSLHACELELVGAVTAHEVPGRVEREGEQMLAAVVVPGPELLLVGRGALERQAALHLLHGQVDADLLPLLANHLRDLREL